MGQALELKNPAMAKKGAWAELRGPQGGDEHVQGNISLPVETSNWGSHCKSARGRGCQTLRNFWNMF